MCKPIGFALKEGVTTNVYADPPIGFEQVYESLRFQITVTVDEGTVKFSQPFVAVVFLVLVSGFVSFVLYLLNIVRSIPWLMRM